jgi:cell wall-associated NlpC family hydrolase
MTPAASVLERAHSQLGLHTIYALGHGGMRSDALRPSDSDNKCDCSGFTAWCLGVSRKTDNPWYQEFNGGWMNTRAMFRDCSTNYGVFDGVEWKDAKPGDLVVFEAAPVGHVGVVTRVDETGPTHAIHCSNGNYMAFGDAIRETNVLIFQHAGARIARCAWVQYEVA